MPYKYLELSPNNVPSSGRVSHARGFPVLTFTVGRQNAVLDMSTIRISGKLNIWTDSTRTAHPSGGASPNLMASPKLGVYGAFDQLVFRHAETKQVAESIRHYGRLMSSLLPIQSSSQDMTGHLGETALISNNYKAFQDTVVRRDGASSFCVPLHSGMTLGGNRLPLREFPLDIELHLAPDSAFFYSQDAAGDLTGLQDCFYEFSDLKLTIEVYEPELDEMELLLPGNGAMEFNSISSYFTTLESTQSIINFRLGLSKVLSAFVNFIPSNFVNNLAQDQYLTYMPATTSSGGVNGALANLLDIAFLKNGMRFPPAFVTDSVYSDTNKTPVVDPQVIKSFLHSIIMDKDHVRTNIATCNSNRNYVVTNNVTDGWKVIPQGGAVYGVGQLYDMLDSEGVDFSNEQFSIHMRNQLDDGNPNSAYLFIKSKNTLAWSGGQIQIIS